MNGGSFIVRSAVAEDVPAIHAIFNHYIVNSTCIFHEEPVSLDWQRRWFEEHGGKHPVFVAESGGEVVGWASLSAYSGRCGYRYTVENSVYVKDGHARRGIGATLLQRLIDAAREHGHHVVVALITADQQPSLALHEKFGFEKVGHFKELGHKFGRWHDVIQMQRMVP